jgi:Right handed beta helix region
MPARTGTRKALVAGATLAAALFSGCTGGGDDSERQPPDHVATLRAGFTCAAGERGHFWAEYRRSAPAESWQRVGRRSFSCSDETTERGSYTLTASEPGLPYEARICASGAAGAPVCSDTDGTLDTDVAHFRFAAGARADAGHAALALPARCDATVTGTPAVQAAAADEANAGKTICVAGSVGDLRLENIDRSPRLTLRAAAGATIRGCVDLFNVKGLRIEGFRFTGCGVNTQGTNSDRLEIVANEFGGYDGYALIVWDGTSHVLFERNHVHDLSLNGQWWAGYGVSSRGGNGRVEDLRIRYNTFERVEGDALEIGSTYGGDIVGNVVRDITEVDDNHTDPLMFWSGSSGFLIKDNRFLDNWNASLFLGGGNRDVELVNNLVVGNRNWCATAGASGSSSAGVHDFVLRNNTFHRCGQAWTKRPSGRFGFALAGDSAAVTLEDNIFSSVEFTTPPPPRDAIVSQSGNVIADGHRAAADSALAARFDASWVPTNLPQRFAGAGYRPAPAGHDVR